MRLRLRAFLVGCLACAGAASLPAVEGFETGTGAWTPSGLWHRVVAPACVSPHAGAACFYFGRDSACDYNDGVVKDASLTSGPVTITAANDSISFWLQYQVESLDPSCYDRLQLEYSYDALNWAFSTDLSVASDPVGGSPSVGFSSGGGVAGPVLWHFVSVPLGAFSGRTIYLRFRFVSSASQAGFNLCGPPDAELDNYLGYALDDISFGDPLPALSLVKSVDPAFAAPGETFTYTLAVTNKDPGPQMLNVWDSLPAGALVQGSNPVGTVSPGRVDWALPAVPAGATVTLQLRVQVDPSVVVPQDWINTAAAASTAPGSATVDASPVLTRVRNGGLSLRKTADKSVATSGDLITYSLLLENFSAVTQSALSLVESLPSAYTLTQAWPAFNGASRWNLSPLPPGARLSFSVWGRGYGDDGQVLVNTAQVLSGPAVAAQASANVTLMRPIEPRITLKAVYPNPAPSDKPGLPQGAFVVYDLNEAMPVTLDIFTLAGEKVRRVYGPSERGLHEVGWDLNNDWGAGVASGVYAFRIWSTLPVIPTPEAFGFIAVLR